VMSQSFHLPWEPIKVIILGGALFTLTHFRALQSIINQFPFCLFPSIVNDIHIIGPLSIVSFAYEHFHTKFYAMSLFIQP
jgi:putative effector of murein hydrolase